MAKTRTKSARATLTATPAPIAAPPPNPAPTQSAAPQSTPPEPTASSSNADKPVHTIRYGAVRSSIWRTESPKEPSFTVIVERFWEDRKGEHSSHTFLAADLQHLAKAAAESRSWIEWQQRRITESGNVLAR